MNVINATADIIGGNMISGNAGQGVNARSASVLIGDPSFGFSSVNTITGNGNAAAQGGVFGFVGSSMVIRDAVISGNNGFGLGLSLKSDGQLSSSTIQNNLPAGSTGDGIRLIFGSGLLSPSRTRSSQETLASAFSAQTANRAWSTPYSSHSLGMASAASPGAARGSERPRRRPLLPL